MRYGPRKTLYNCFVRRAGKRHLGQVLRGAGCHRRPACRTAARQHPREGAPLGGGRKRGKGTQAVGRLRGGRTSKIHCVADVHDRPVAFAPMPGNVADISMALPLLGAVAAPKRLIADKAYDAESLRRWLKARCIRHPLHHDPHQALPARPTRLPAPQPDRAPIPPPQEPAAPGHPLRPPGRGLPLRTRPDRRRHGRGPK
ncbi:hypothetical protein HMPREF9946_04447 [Acetobacteraceae bacterium AT-5844]|nr:hypothetical protein HMPREF9946_04447 [Acetobacteraceae bacterium AT-5844]